MRTLVVALVLLASMPVLAQSGEYLGSFSNQASDRYRADSINNPYGQYGSRYSPKSIHNPYGTYGSKYSPKSVNNPYTHDAPKIYDEKGNYRGRLSINPYDPESIANPYGRYGNKYSPDSINNKYGPGNPYNGQRFRLYGEK